MGRWKSLAAYCRGFWETIPGTHRLIQMLSDLLSQGASNQVENIKITKPRILRLQQARNQMHAYTMTVFHLQA